MFFIDDEFFPILKGFDWVDVLVDTRTPDGKGSDGFYPMQLEGPDGNMIDRPLESNVEGIGQSIRMSAVRFFWRDVVSTVIINCHINAHRVHGRSLELSITGVLHSAPSRS